MDFFFSHARTALKYGLMGLDFKSGDELLLPALICEVVVHPLNEIGVVPRYYPVSTDLKPDWKALPGLINEKTRGMLAVHYFGQPQDIVRCREFCRLQDIVFIEDNAHGYGGTWEDIPLGSFGEIGISSPRKSMGWRNGGILHWNRESIPSFADLPAQPGHSRWKSKSAIKNILYSIKGGRRFLRKMPDYSSQETGRESPISSWNMDQENIQWIKSRKNELDLLVSRRRNLWETWKRWADLNRLLPVYDELAPGASPLAFPVRTKSANESRKWFQWGWDTGLYVHSWPSLPRDIVEKDPSTLNLWSTMVCFPIEPNMDSDRLMVRLRI